LAIPVLSERPNNYKAQIQSCVFFFDCLMHQLSCDFQKKEKKEMAFEIGS
jgi:hypothetical protein